MSLGGVPAIVAHPDWERPAPVMVWMHGRTATKELDPGRFLRWIRAGIAGVSLDLPGHGERFDADLQRPERSLDVVAQMTGEIDRVTDALASREFGGVLDIERVGIGGMSAGGMATLRRLCDGHDFVCAAVESTTGWLAGLYLPANGAPPPWGVGQHPEQVESLDASRHLEGFRPIPLLALHATTDTVVPYAVQAEFLRKLRSHYASLGADPAIISERTWAHTGAPYEHSGFGRYSNEAKNEQTEFLAREFFDRRGIPRPARWEE